MGHHGTMGREDQSQEHPSTSQYRRSYYPRLLPSHTDSSGSLIQTLASQSNLLAILRLSTWSTELCAGHANSNLLGFVAVISLYAI